MDVRLFECFGTGLPHLWHDHLTLEASSHGIVDSFWLSPVRRYTLESVALVTEPALCSYVIRVRSFCNHQVSRFVGRLSANSGVEGSGGGGSVRTLLHDRNVLL